MNESHSNVDQPQGGSLNSPMDHPLGGAPDQGNTQRKKNAKRIRPPRQQASVIPFRWVPGVGVEFCLITTRRSARWGFPKGRIRNRQSAQSAAMEEAWEEAGLKGQVLEPILGRYAYKKKGQHQSVVVMLMEVSEAAPQWQEASQRTRRWANAEVAKSLLCRSTLQQMLQAAIERLEDPEVGSG